MPGADELARLKPRGVTVSERRLRCRRRRRSGGGAQRARRRLEASIGVLSGLALPLGAYFVETAFLAFFVFFLVAFFLCVTISGFGSNRVLPE
jgi:hypothetical protein